MARSGSGGTHARRREPRLLLLGSSVRWLASSAAASRQVRLRYPGGLLTVDYFGDADLRDLASRLPLEVIALPRDLGLPRSSAALGRAALGLQWDAVIYGGGLENRPGLLRLLGRHGELLGNAPATVRAVRDPGALFPFLRRAGLPHAATDCGADRAPAASTPPHLWKRRRGGGGAGVRFALPEESRPGGHYLQRYLQGPCGSVAFVASGGRATIVGVSRQINGWQALGGGGFRYGGSIVGASAEWLSGRARTSLSRTVEALAERFGLAGLNGFDFVLENGVPRLLEVNPRYTASMELHEERCGASLVELHLGALSGLPCPAAPPAVRPGAPACLAKGILYTDRPALAPAPGTLAALGARDLPARGELLEEGQPVCTLFAAGRDHADCVRGLELRAAEARSLLRPAGTRRPGPHPARRTA